MLRRTMGLAAVAALAALPIATACSGDAGLTKKEFIAKGDAVCKRLAGQSGKVEEPTDAAGIDEYLGKVLKIADDARDAFAELDPPKDGDAVKQALLASLDSTIAQARKARTAAAKKDLDAVQKALDAAGKAAVKGDKAAKAYGFRECSNS
jgi:hypothetical protein